MQLPTEFADIGEAHRDRLAAGRPDLADMPERERRVAEIVRRYPRQQLSRARPHDGERRALLRDVVEPDVEAAGNVIADPRGVMGAKPRSGDESEAIRGEPRDGQVAFDAAARVQQLRIGQPPRRLCDVARAEKVQRAISASAPLTSNFANEL